MQLLQALTPDGGRQILAIEDDLRRARRIEGVRTIYELAQQALNESLTLTQAAHRSLGTHEEDAQSLAEQGRLLAPLDHPDAAHMLVSGTGLTHLGSAQGRDQMHRSLAEADSLTDSMKMFRMGLEGGKPADGRMGVQPEWFYKGDGSIIAPPGGDLSMPSFALDGGEEPEIVGLYLIDAQGEPRRLGYALGNEFSDHVTERQNYLYLAHSKLRPASFGPCMLLGELPQDVRGVSRIVRNGATLWEKPFLSGEANMSHTLANLEAHHFKYAQFLRPGDVHVHFFGTATLSCADGIATEPGDVFHIEAGPFALPLKNTLRRQEDSAQKTRVRAL